MRRVTATATALFLTLAPVLCLAREPGVPASESTCLGESFALTASGGVSLGSYEAGVNWALLTALKRMERETCGSQPHRPELLALTGASAGSVNAVLTALEWLLDPQKSGELRRAGIAAGAGVDANLMRNVWVGIGADQLLPQDAAVYWGSDAPPGPDVPGYRTPDGIFSRGGSFQPTVKTILDLLECAAFLPNRRVPLGVVVTREQPVEFDTAGARTRNQRFVFVFEFVTDAAGRGSFESSAGLAPADPDSGMVAYLPGQRRTGLDGAQQERFVVSNADVIRLLFASSAFPVAFGKVELEYCSTVEGGPDPRGRCPAGTRATRAAFVDGGVFDNIPLGAAKALAVQAALGKEGKSAEGELSRRPIRYFIVSPGTRRVREPEPEPERQESTYGLRGMTSFLPGVLQSVGDYELFTLLRSGEWGAEGEPVTTRKLELTTRHFSVTGAYLGHFGAFLDRPFREFDYYAGVYDGVVKVALDICEPQKASDPERCLGQQTLRVYEMLGIDGSEKARTVFARIAAHEHPDHTLSWSPWVWLFNTFRDEDGQMRAIYESLPPIGEPDGEAKFRRFIRNLRESGYRPHDATMRQIMARCDDGTTTSWYSPTVALIERRLEELEAAEVRATGDAESWDFLAAAVSLGLGKFFDPRQSTWGPSSEAAGSEAWKFFPYALDLDVKNGGAALSHLPQVRWSNVSFDFPVTLASVTKVFDEWRGITHVGCGISLHPAGSLHSYGVAGTAGYWWGPVGDYDRLSFGAVLYAEFYRTLRVGFGVRSLSHDLFSNSNTYLTIGISDLPGLVSRW